MHSQLFFALLAASVCQPGGSELQPPLIGAQCGDTPIVVAAHNTAEWSKDSAAHYMDDRVNEWVDFSSADRGKGDTKISCISCHAVLPFTLARPALRKLMGTNQPTVMETKLIKQTQMRVEHWQDLDSSGYRLYYDSDEQKKQQSWGTEAVLNAVVLAFDDHFQARKGISAATKTAFVNLWQTQVTHDGEAGSWEWLNFGLEPWETKDARYFGAVLAALAVGTAPGYYAPGMDADLDRNVELLRTYLRGKMAAQNLHNRMWLIWASSRLPELLTKEEQQNIADALFQKQQADGGWNLSSLGTKSPGGFVPDANSDGYATGIVLHVLQTAGINKNDPKIAKGLSWLRSHQETTGAWRTHSVNRKRDPDSHVGKFMSDAATAYAVLALSH